MAAGGQPPPPSGQPPTLEDIFIGVNSSTMMEYGCDALNVFRVDTSEAVYLGPTSNNPGRLAGSPDMSAIVSINLVCERWFPGLALRRLLTDAQGQEPDLGRCMYLLRHTGDDWTHWEARNRVVGVDFLGTGAAILPDGDTLLAGTRDFVPSRRPPFQGPSKVEKFLLSEITPRYDGVGTDTMGPSHGAIEVPFIPIEIHTTADGRLAHILTLDPPTFDPLVMTIETATMREAGMRIPLAPAEYEGLPPINWDKADAQLELLNSALSRDERYLVTNRYNAPNLNIADLVERRSWTLPIPGDPSPAGQRSFTAGVDLNRGPVNNGLLALRRNDHVGVYRWDPHGPLVEVGRSADSPGGGADPVAALAWSARGDAIITVAALLDGKSPAYRIFDVRDEGQSVAFRGEVWDCVLDVPNDPGVRWYLSYPGDILTANGYLPTASPTATATPSPTVTPTPMATATPSPAPIYLPIALADACRPTAKPVDVVLILDASTSMQGQAGSGGTKLASALRAAATFVELMDWTPLSGRAPDRVAVVAFNATAWLQVGLTSDRSRLQAAFDRVPSGVAEGTRLDLALEKALEVLEGAPGPEGRLSAGILLTDGMPNRVPTPVPAGSQAETVLAAADRARRQGVRLYTIGLGRPDAADPAAGIDAELLRRIATEPDMYYETPDAEELAGIYGEIARRLTCPPGRAWPSPPR